VFFPGAARFGWIPADEYVRMLRTAGWHDRDIVRAGLSKAEDRRIESENHVERIDPRGISVRMIW
jgi:hypothetical protein